MDTNDYSKLNVDELYNMIDSNKDNINNEMIDKLNSMIEDERVELNSLLDSFQSIDNKFKIPVKYKNMSLEELEVKYIENQTNIMEMITIYKTMYIMINRTMRVV